MAPRKRRTTSADRSRNKGKGQSKVTGKTPTSRTNRQKASNAKVTRSGQGSGRGRVTNASQRTSTGRARVTGGSRPALPPGKKGGSIVKSTSTRRTAAQTKAGRAAAGTKGSTVRTGQKPSAIVKQSRAQKIKGSIRTGSYAQDLKKLRSLLKKGGAVALRQARALARAIGPRALKAAPGLVVGGSIVGSAGRPNQRTMSKLGLLKAAEYNNPLDPKRSKPKPKPKPRQMANLPKDYKKTEAAAFKAAEKPRSGGGGASRVSKSNNSGGAGVPRVAKKSAPKPKKLTDKQRMVGKSSAERLAVWAKANRKMIEKSGTKKQREILANALKKKK